MEISLYFYSQSCFNTNRFSHNGNNRRRSEVEGIIYYWFMWAAWIVCTFMWRKGKWRTWITAFILVNIIFSNSFIAIADFQVRVNYFLFLLLGYFLLANRKITFSFFLTSVTLTFAYSGMMLFQLYDPVWFIFGGTWIISVLVSFLSLYIGKTAYEQFAYVLIAVCQGEFLYSFILSNIYSGLTVGTEQFLDITILSCTLIYIWTLYKNMIFYVEQLLQKPVKEKQG